MYTQVFGLFTPITISLIFFTKSGNSNHTWIDLFGVDRVIVNTGNGNTSRVVSLLTGKSTVDEQMIISKRRLFNDSQPFFLIIPPSTGAGLLVVLSCKDLDHCL